MKILLSSKGEFEGMEGKDSPTPEWCPDFGPAERHPGTAEIQPSEPVCLYVAYNINLNTPALPGQRACGAQQENRLIGGDCAIARPRAEN